MLVVDRKRQTWEDRLFRDLPGFLAAGDCLILNDTRVFPARLFGRKVGHDRQMEIFLLEPLSDDRKRWAALVRPGRHLHAGARVFITPTLRADVLETSIRGRRVVEFTAQGDIDEELEAAGHVPLPPYIHRADLAADRDRYQTVFARHKGSVAAPTAGLHFTGEILDRCREAGAQIARVTLHVGLGTFQPLLEEEVSANRLHHERFQVTEENAALIRQARRRIAVGTTSVRTLETLMRNGGLSGHSGETDIFLYPGCRFAAVDGLLTNFHLPRSSLLLLVCALGGTSLILSAYRHAVEQRYRFYSYGDCMLIL